MNIVRFDPLFGQLASYQDRMNRLFEGSLARKEEPDSLSGNWIPAVDILETENDLVLKAELPGFKPEDVDIRVENNTLTLKGERKFEVNEDKEHYHRRERVFGTFMRSFILPSGVEVDKVSAEYSNGVLQVTLPKREETKPKQITVKIK